MKAAYPGNGIIVIRTFILNLIKIWKFYFDYAMFYIICFKKIITYVSSKLEFLRKKIYGVNGIYSVA